MSKYRRTLVWVVLFCFVAGFTFTCEELTCEPPEQEESDDGDCGELVKPDFLRNDLEVSFGPVTNYDGDPELFCFMYMKHVTNVCALKHVQVYLSFAVKWPYVVDDGVHVMAEIWYGLSFYERPVEMEYHESFLEFLGQDNFGLKHYYGDDPADFYIDMHICYPYKATETASYNYFWDEVFDEIKFSVDYHKPKK